MTARGVLAFPMVPEGVPNSLAPAGRYLVRFARTEEELDRILRLRYEVFNLELREGLDTAHANGRDEDEFDRRFHHLLIEERATREIVGTYRMQTAEMAEAGGYYSAGIFQVESLPEAVRRSAVEVGRACIARPHRNGRVLRLLWKGLAGYLEARAAVAAAEDPGSGPAAARREAASAGFPSSAAPGGGVRIQFFTPTDIEFLPAFLHGGHDSAHAWLGDAGLAPVSGVLAASRP